MVRVTKYLWMLSSKRVCTCVDEGCGVQLAVSMLACMPRSVHCCAESACTHKVKRHRLIALLCLASVG